MRESASRSGKSRPSFHCHVGPYASPARPGPRSAGRLHGGTLTKDNSGTSMVTGDRWTVTGGTIQQSSLDFRSFAPNSETTLDGNLRLLGAGWHAVPWHSWLVMSSAESELERFPSFHGAAQCSRLAPRDEAPPECQRIESTFPVAHLAERDGCRRFRLLISRSEMATRKARATRPRSPADVSYEGPVATPPPSQRDGHERSDIEPRILRRYAWRTA